MIEAGDKVTIKGEEGMWEVDMAGNASPMVRIIQNHNAATWRMIDKAELVLVSKALTGDDTPRLIPSRGILD
jgi:hypothetical protein